MQISCLIAGWVFLTIQVHLTQENVGLSLFEQLFMLNLTYGVASNNETLKIVFQQRKLEFICEE
jgi:hypothetical protein